MHEEIEPQRPQRHRKVIKIAITTNVITGKSQITNHKYTDSLNKFCEILWLNLMTGP
jgi:hypothetical protein